MARAELIDDIAIQTLKRFTKNKWIDISMSFQKYFFNKLILKKKKDEVDGGLKLNWSFQYRGIDTFRDSGVYMPDSVATRDIFIQGEVPWYKSQASYTWDVGEKSIQGASDVKLINIMEGKVHAMWNSFFQGMEIRFWKAAGSPTSDPAEFYGLKTWVVQNSTVAFGFNGGDATGFTGSGLIGKLRSTYTGLKNGTFTYQTISDDDGLKKIAEACEKSYFEAPDDYNAIDGGEPDFGIYTTFENKSRCDRLVKAQNDNLGKELWHGRPTIKGCPIAWVPALDTQYLADGTANDAYDSGNPIYGINWLTTRVVFNENCNMQTSKPIMRAGMHNVRDVFLDNECQLEVRNSRTNWVGKAA